jgi:iron complex transport system substrate-binding protein
MPIFNSEEVITGIVEIPEKIISLVPSVTETLVKFNLSDGIVGVTDYCPPVRFLVKEPQRVGGTKSLDIEKIVQLKPDLVIANREENSKEDIMQLDEACISIWLTFPKTADVVIEDLWVMARIFHMERHLAPKIEALQRSLEWTRLATKEQQPKRYFCPIWVGEHVDWWMTFNQYTYAHDILACCGGVNAFAARERRYPLEADLGLQPAIEVDLEDTRYPRVAAAEIVEANPDIIFLPSEPYAFSKNDAQKLSELLPDVTAVVTNKIHFIDGRLITWHGIHMAEAITSLPHYFQD